MKVGKKFRKLNSSFESVIKLIKFTDSKNSSSRFHPVINLFKLPECKRSQSAIIATVLLILIVIISALVVMQFAIPFVKNQLSGSECFDIAGKLTITSNTKYTCFDATNNQVKVQIHVGDLNESIRGFRIEIGSGGSSDSYEIKQGKRSAPTGVTMLDGNTILEIPGKTQERTYIFPSIVKTESIKIYGILASGKTCDVADSYIDIPDC